MMIAHSLNPYYPSCKPPPPPPPPKTPKIPRIPNAWDTIKLGKKKKKKELTQKHAYTFWETGGIFESQRIGKGVTTNVDIDPYANPKKHKKASAAKRKKTVKKARKPHKRNAPNPTFSFRF